MLRDGSTFAAGGVILRRIPNCGDVMEKTMRRIAQAGPQWFQKPSVAADSEAVHRALAVPDLLLDRWPFQRGRPQAP